jgi:hypothetical protein
VLLLLLRHFLLVSPFLQQQPFSPPSPAKSAPFKTRVSKSIANLHKSLGKSTTMEENPLAEPPRQPTPDPQP